MKSINLGFKLNLVHVCCINILKKNERTFINLLLSQKKKKINAVKKGGKKTKQKNINSPYLLKQDKLILYGSTLVDLIFIPVKRQENVSKSILFSVFIG